MHFQSTSLSDATLIELQPFGDQRGMFARTYCRDKFMAAGLPTEWVQQNMSTSANRGTIRGMHFQRAPHREGKLIRCVRGTILDVIIDLRADSPSYLQHEGFELSDGNKHQLFVPPGFAHGFQTLTDDVEVTYLVTERYTPLAEGGVRYNDPQFAIDWPLPVSTISDKDAAWPLFDSLHPLAL
ncbi:dTDP-4-dehydrorhamnose 3,5-epimerase [Stakelama sediminis]|uniref:dTDP-4-dehydrorhamnose 3,5-epimerase n=1 Tax=Stakelama sediminis TaxID=463200 RepID=A0A840YYW2_9SPHN|nr:dTDP-4-dehydrorhamnose 3,5-epimerase [Stakelama sediminis]MBB5718704.1 dTDP-4-dehydrorhamnose 3,5-epimerase [Stakelama sediminis]